MTHHMTHPLGRWALIDLETTGVNPMDDSIIDVGFLQFEGTTLVRKYSSLVHYDGKLPKFIEKLTSITSKMVSKAPDFEDVLGDILDLYGHTLLAHNSSFEESFLKKYFDEIDDGTDREIFLDSLPFLGILEPEKSSLKLERFILDYGLSDKELHRGYEDSVDLLKVMIVAVMRIQKNHEQYHLLRALFKTYRLEDHWYYKFFSLTSSELLQISDQIEFDPTLYLDKAPLEVNDSLSRKVTNFNFTGENISKIFSDTEEIKKIFPSYTPRQSQIDFSLRVGQAFKNEVHAMVEAPTGTGKTLGYLVPSLLLHLEKGEPVLIATGTKTLQKQILEKDIFLIRKFLGLPDTVKFERLVGSSNHFCELLFRQVVDEENTLFETSDETEKGLAFLYFEHLFWMNSQRSPSSTLTRDDLATSLKNSIKTLFRLEKNIQVDFRTCTGHKCPFRETCSYHRGLKAAKEASVIIGNHALMLSWPKALPRPPYVVVDEAHRIEGEATDAFSIEFSFDDLDSLKGQLITRQGLGPLFYLIQRFALEGQDHIETIRELSSDAASLALVLSDHLPRLKEQVELIVQKKSNYTELYWNEYPLLQEISDPVEQGILNTLGLMSEAFKIFGSKIERYASLFDLSMMKDDSSVIAYTRFDSFYSIFKDLALGVDSLLLSKENVARSINHHAKYGVLFKAEEINIGKRVASDLIATSRAVVFTSATLGSSIAGARAIEWASGYSFIEDPKKRFKAPFFLPAVYDYENKAKVFLCDDTPKLYDQKFVPEILSSLIPLIRNIGGRSLLLFSAHVRFQAAVEILLSKLDGEFPLFIQGMGGNVVEEFKREGAGVLVGMESFGEGIDIPGDALSFVFIDKIPDLRQDHVVNLRRLYYERSFGNEFADYFLASRTRSLHQKLGRLLRTEADRGGAIIVDSRVSSWKGNSMKTFMDQMKPYKIERATLKEACLQVEQFLTNS